MPGVSTAVFNVEMEWTSLQSTQPALSEFQKTNQDVQILFSGNNVQLTFDNGYVSEGHTREGLHGANDGFFIRYRTVKTSFALEGMLGGSFNVFDDGTAELVSFGSGLPIVGVLYGKLRSR